MADLIRREHRAETYKGTVIGPVSNEKFVHCHFEDCLILVCHTCRFDGCTFRRCTTTAFTESVITFCTFYDTDVRTGSRIMLQDCIFKKSNLTDDSRGYFPAKVNFYSVEQGLQPFIGESCYLNGNRITDGEIKLEATDHTVIGNMINEAEAEQRYGAALSTGPITP